jgi:hypothetical protein
VFSVITHVIEIIVKSFRKKMRMTPSLEALRI